MKKNIVFIILMLLIFNLVLTSNIDIVHGEDSKTSSLGKEANPTESKVLVNGKNISFDAYLIDQNNYFKLRDLAYIVRGTEKQFEVLWDGNKKAINLISNKAYTPDGKEMTKGKSGKVIAKLSTSVIYKDGLVEELVAYTINGNNYFKLRDIAKAFDIGVTWDGETGTIGIDTSLSYIDPNNQEDQALPIADIYFSNESGIKKYLEGEWVFNNPYISDLTCKMKIDKDLNVQLYFYGDYADSFKGNYSGKIKFEKVNAEADELPDAISIELNDSEWPGGDYFFLHRTIYNGKRVMALFFAGNGNGIFDILGDVDNFIYGPDEIIFEKTSGEISKLAPSKNDKFEAVYWGKAKDGKSLWLDDVQWAPKNEDLDTIYPWPMIAYDNYIRESVLYSIVAEKRQDILGDDLFPGQVYYVETDEEGRIKHFISAEFKRFLEESQDDYFFEENNYYFEDGSEDFMDPEFKDLIFSILIDIDEIQEYLAGGMSILVTGETTVIDGGECYDIALGTNHGESFVREIHYSVNFYNRQVYRLDFMNNVWEIV